MKKNKPPKVVKHLIFLDIDGTLIKPNQKTNSGELPTTIQRLSKKGVLFGLNSNRAQEDVAELSEKFSLNGPLILENGTYFIYKGKSHYLVKKPARIQKIVFKLVKKFSQENSLMCDPEVTDTVAYIKSKKGKIAALRIVMNANRKYTASIHVFRRGTRDRVLAKKLCLFLEHAFSEKNLKLSVECPEAFGNVIVSPRGIDKGLALRRLKKHFINYQFSMVGDDPADLKTLHEIAYFFAVANAQKKVLEKASFVSKYSYTKGVVDILKRFEKEYLN